MSLFTSAGFVDFAERVGATFAETFLAVLIADSSGVVQVTDLKIAAIAGGLAAGKYILLKLNTFQPNP